MSLSQTLYHMLSFCCQRKIRNHSDMTEKMLTGTISFNTNKQPETMNLIEYIFNDSKRVFYLFANSVTIINLSNIQCNSMTKNIIGSKADSVLQHSSL